MSTCDLLWWVKNCYCCDDVMTAKWWESALVLGQLLCRSAKGSSLVQWNEEMASQQVPSGHFSQQDLICNFSLESHPLTALGSCSPPCEEPFWVLWVWARTGKGDAIQIYSTCFFICFPRYYTQILPKLLDFKEETPFGLILLGPGNM